MSYQIQYTLNVAEGVWTNLGSRIHGTGDLIEEHIEPGLGAQFFRVLVEYNAASEPQIVARRFTAEATCGAVEFDVDKSGVLRQRRLRRGPRRSLGLLVPLRRS